jgi:AcrR family transcriptional regulator
VSRYVGANIKNPELLAERREAVIRAAIEVFMEKGFHGCSARDIASRAGMTQGSLYNYVKSKEDILYLVCDQAVAHYYTDVEQAVASTGHPGERLVRAITATVSSMYERRRNILIVYRESHSLDRASRKAILARADTFVSLLKRVIAEAVAAGYARVSDIDLAATTVTYIPTIFALRGWRMRDASKSTALLYVRDFILAGLGVAPVDSSHWWQPSEREEPEG